jgi:hypothetical protein
VSTLSGEDDLREQFRAQADEQEKKDREARDADRHKSARFTNPMSEEALRPKPSYEDLQKQNQDLKRQIDNITENLLPKGQPVELDKIANNGGPVEPGWGNKGGIASATYIQYAVKKYASGEWTEEDVERYLFYEAGWLDKARVRSKQIAKFFKRKTENPRSD